MSEMGKAAIKAIKQLTEAGTLAFIAESRGPEIEVIAKFKTVQQRQAFHQALIDCGKVGQEITAKDEADAKAKEWTPLKQAAAESWDEQRDHIARQIMSDLKVPKQQQGSQAGRDRP